MLLKAPYGSTVRIKKLANSTKNPMIPIMTIPTAVTRTIVQYWEVSGFLETVKIRCVDEKKLSTPSFKSKSTIYGHSTPQPF